MCVHFGVDLGACLTQQQLQLIPGWFFRDRGRWKVHSPAARALGTAGWQRVARQGKTVSKMSYVFAMQELLNPVFPSNYPKTGD